MNTAALIPDAVFLLSRLAWAGLGLAGVAGAAVIYARQVQTGVSGRGPRSAGGLTGFLRGPRPVAAEIRPQAEPTLADLQMTTRPLGFRGAAVAIARSEIRDLLVRPGMYLCVPLILWIAMARASVIDSLLTSGISASRQYTELGMFMCLLLLFYTVESLYRERGRRMHEIFRSAPVRTGAILFGKALGNSVMAAFVLVVVLLASAGVIVHRQIAHGSPVGFELWPFVAVWGGVLLPDLHLLDGAGHGALRPFPQPLRRVRGRNGGVHLHAAELDGGTVQELDQQLDRHGGSRLERHGGLRAARPAAAAEPPALPQPGPVADRALGPVVPATRPRRHRTGGPPESQAAAPGRSAGASAGHPGRSCWHPCWCSAAAPAIRDRRPRSGRRTTGPATSRPGSGFRMPAVSHVDLDLDIEPAERSVAVDGAYTFRNHRDYAYDRFPLTAGPWEPIEWTLGGEPYEPENRDGLYVFTPGRAP